jgi:hypothetical protein
MEWLPDILKYNNIYMSESLLALIDSLAETTYGVYTKFVDLALVPLAAFLLGVIESWLKYFVEEGELQKYEEATAQSYHSALSWLQLSKFQSKLIWEFFIIIFGNCFLLILAWWVYGERIKIQFMQSGSDRRQRNFEQIRDGYSDLKLPKEMDFKFK